MKVWDGTIWSSVTPKIFNGVALVAVEEITPQFESAGAILTPAVSTAANFDIPLGVELDDIVLVVMRIDSNAAVTLATGFTEATSSPVVVTGTDAHDLHIYWHRAAGTEGPGTYNFVTPNANRTGRAFRYSNCGKPGSPFETTNSAIKTTTTDNTVPSVQITTLGSSRQLVIAGSNFDLATFVAPNNFVERVDANGFYVADLRKPLLGSTGPLDAVMSVPSSAGAWIGSLIPLGTSTTPPASLFSDDFTTQDMTKWNGYNADVSVVSGQLNVIPDATWGRVLTTVNRFNLTGGILSIEVPSLGSAQDASLRLMANPGVDEIEMYYEFGNLKFRQNVGGVYDITSIAYDATNHRWWRIRESAGTIYFETAPSPGTTWTTRRTMVWTIPSISSMQIELQAYTTSGTTPTIFDNINLGPPVGFNDSFTTQDSAKWTGYSAPNVIATGGQLNIVPDNTFNRILTSVGTYNLTGTEAHVEVPGLGSSQVQTFRLYVTGAINNYFEILYEVPNIKFRESVAGALTDVSITYNATNHRWWRIRESGGTVYFETAPSPGTTWTVQRSKAWAIPAVNALLVQFLAYTASGTSPALFDNFNL